MTDLLCPLCEAVLRFPPEQDPRAFMDVLSQHPPRSRHEPQA